MAFIVRTGLGTKKLALVIPFGEKTFRTVKEEEKYGGIVKVERTNSYPINNNWLIEQYRFGYYNQNGKLESYLLGNPWINKSFYLQEARNIKAGPSINNRHLKVFSEKAKVRWANIFNLKNNQNHKGGLSFARNVYLLVDYMQEYLRNNGIEKTIVQAEFELVNMLDVLLKLGWRDMDRQRKIEQYIGNKVERKKHLTIPERLAGTVYLEYPLNGQQ